MLRMLGSECPLLLPLLSVAYWASAGMLSYSEIVDLFLWYTSYSGCLLTFSLWVVQHLSWRTYNINLRDDLYLDHVDHPCNIYIYIFVILVFLNIRSKRHPFTWSHIGSRPKKKKNKKINLGFCDLNELLDIDTSHPLTFALRQHLQHRQYGSSSQQGQGHFCLCHPLLSHRSRLVEDHSGSGCRPHLQDGQEGCHSISDRCCPPW